MFEDSTFESAGRIHTRSRAWGVAALLFNSSILAALILIPLIYPEALPRHWMNILLVAPPPPAAPQPAEPQPQHVTRVIPQMDNGRMFAPPLIPRDIVILHSPEAFAPGIEIPGADLSPAGPGNPGAIFAAHHQLPEVRVAPIGPRHISSGVAEGMLIQKTIPRYPPIAVASRTQGTVVLQAMISKSGAIENLRVLSGSPMLQQAAIDAVSQWRYRPYLLDGQPVEVETTINVVFSLHQ